MRPTHTPTPSSRTTAIVLGASMAGLLAARVLSDHVDEVLVLERDHLHEGDQPRRFVPQGRHAHVLLAAGQQRLDRWFPGMRRALLAAGAVALDTRDAVWHQGGHERVRSDLGFVGLSMTRPLLEGTVRRRLLAERRNVSLVDGATVDGPVVQRGRVVGVEAHGRLWRADLVVDATGRATRSFDQLHEQGFPAPEVSAIRIDMAYGTRVLPRRSADLDGTHAVLVGDPAANHRIGVMVPVEGDRWVVTVAGFHGDVPPGDEVGFEHFARSLPSPVIADVCKRADITSPVLHHRLPTSQRRHVERLARPPRGFVALGDAICSFNPIYGQGMSSAALQAEALGHEVARHGLTSAAMVLGFYARAATVVDTPWRLAAVADFADPRTTGARPRGAALLNRWLDVVSLACHTSPQVARRTTRVLNLISPPETLLAPGTVARVLLAARRSPARRDGRPRDGRPPRGRRGRPSTRDARATSTSHAPPAFHMH